MAAQLWLVEDNAYYREGILGLLESEHEFDCTGSFSSLEELELYLDSPASGIRPDLVLMDIQLDSAMPDKKGGIRGIALLKSHFPDVPIIMLTVNDKSETIFEALQTGASGYLLKDMPWSQICAALREALLGGMMLPAAVAFSVRDFFQRLSPEGDYQLTEREIEVLGLMCDGLSQKHMAEALFISSHTISNHVRSIYRKLHVHSATEAVSVALRKNLIV